MASGRTKQLYGSEKSLREWDRLNDLDNRGLSLYGLLGQQRLYSVSLMALGRTMQLYGSEKSLREELNYLAFLHFRIMTGVGQS